MRILYLKIYSEFDMTRLVRIGKKVTIPFLTEALRPAHRNPFIGLRPLFSSMPGLWEERSDMTCIRRKTH